MSYNKCKLPTNAEGERHGYWEQYYFGDTQWDKGVFKNDVRVGYWEHKFIETTRKRYYIR